MKRIVSLSVHRSAAAAIDTCLNYIVVGQVDAVVVHVNAASSFDVRLFALLLDATEPLRGKVFINPVRLTVPHIAGTDHLMHLHRVHLGNYIYLRSFLQFDWFLMAEGSSLLVKKGLPGYVHGSYDGLDLVPEAVGIPWLERVQPDTISEKFKQFYSCLDGAFFKSERFERVARLVFEYGKRITPETPHSEFVVPGAYKALFPQQWTKRPFIWTRWETQGFTLSEVQNMLRSQHVQTNRFGIKGVSFLTDDRIRCEVGMYYGYRLWTEKALAQGTQLVKLPVAT